MARYELCGENPNNRKARAALQNVDPPPIHDLPIGPVTDNVWPTSYCDKQFPRKFIEVNFYDGGERVLGTNVSLVRMVMQTQLKADNGSGAYSIDSNWGARTCLGASIPLNTVPSTTSTYTQWTRRGDMDPYRIEIWTVPGTQQMNYAGKAYCYTPCTSICWWYKGNYYWQHYQGVGYVY